MAGRAKENLPGGSLKYLFVYLKIRIFKCSCMIVLCERGGAEIASLREQMGTGGERQGHFFHADMSFLQWVAGSVYVCLNYKTIEPKESHLENKRVGLCSVWSHVSTAGCEILGCLDMFGWEFQVQNIHGRQCVAPIEFAFTSNSMIILASVWALLRPLLCSSLWREGT